MRKLNVYEKILIIMIAILSIFSITYRVYGWNKFMNPWHRQGYGYEEEDWIQYIKSGNITTHLFSGSSSYSGSGIIQVPGGKTNGEEPHDNGATAVGSNGSDGNIGVAGSWNGSANFDRNSKISSSGENFTPSNVTDVIEGTSSTSENVIWLKDLCNYVGVLCSAHGMPLTGSNNYIPKIYTTGIYEHDVQSVSPDKIVSYNLPEAESAVQQVASGDISESTYQKVWRTPCEYEREGTKSCIGDNNGPAKAFVLSEFNNITGGGEKTPLQIAWWNLLGQSSDSNSLLGSALEFQNYINDVKVSNSSSSRVTSTGESEIGFDINYDPKFVRTDVTTVFDSNKNQWVIGPFKIDYVQYNDFAYIYNLDIYADNSDNPINKSEYKIAVAKDGNKSNLQTLEQGMFPDKNTDFYIILNYNENIKKITDMKVNFQYQNARGEYTDYNGTYSEVHVQGKIYGEYSEKIYEEIEEATQFVNECMEFGFAVWDPISHEYHISDADTVLASWTKNIQRYIESFGGMNDKLEMWGSAYVEYNYEDYGFLERYVKIPADIPTPIVLLSEAAEKITYWKGMYLGYCAALESINNYSGETKKPDGTYTDDYQKRLDARDDYIMRMENHLDWGKNATSLYHDLQNYCEKVDGGSPFEDTYRSKVRHSVPRPLQTVIWKDYTYTAKNGLTAQKQTVVGPAARWWELKEIHWKDLSPNEGKIKIIKEFNKENQAKEGDTFNFELKVNHYDDEGKPITTTESLSITYHEGKEEQSVESQVYKWDADKTTPTYEVTEVSITPEKSYRSISETTYKNKSGTMENGKTVSVTCINKFEEHSGSLEIKKELEETKLDDDGTYKNNQYKFKVTITGKCEFSFNGKNYSLNDNESVVLNDSTNENPNQNQILVKPGETWKLENIKWYGSNEAPTYVVEEIVEPIEKEGRTYTYTIDEIRNSTGSLNDKTAVTVVAKNKSDISKGKISIFKTLEDANKLSEDEIQKLTFKFKVNVYSDSNYTQKLKNAAGEEYHEEEIVTTIRREDDDSGKFNWYWEGTTDEYVWLKGNKAYYKIEEDENWCPMHKDNGCPLGNECFYRKSIKFDSSANSIITGEIVQEEDKEEFTPAKPINKVTEPSKGKIVINKKISSELDELLKDPQNDDYKVEIVLKVSGTFGIDKNGNGKLDENEWYDDVTLQIPNKSDSRTTIDYDKIVQLSNSTDYDKNTFITFTKADFSNQTFSFTTPEIYWYGKAPQFEILEDTKTQSVKTSDGAIKEVHSSGIPNGWKSFADAIKDESNVYTYTVNIENSIDEYNSGYIHLIKKLENQEWCTVDYIKNLEFKFKIEIKDGDTIKSTEYVTLGGDINPVIYDEQNDEYRWEYTTGKYSWKKSESPLKYTITEIDSYDGIVLDKAEEIDSNNVENKTEKNESNNDLVNEIEENKVDENIKNTWKFDGSTKSLSGILKDAGEAENKENIKINTTNCQFENKIPTDPEKFTIKIKKKFTDSNLINNETLKIQYKVNITGKFEYNGNKYNGTYVIDNSGNIKEQYNDSNEYVTITAKSNNWAWESSEIKYYGDKPTYNIEEVENNDTTLISSQNSTGTIGDTAEFVNDPKDKGGYLSVTKQLNSEVDADTKSNAVADPNQVFTFKVTIGENVQYIKLKDKETWTSNYIKWKSGETAPKYKVEEIMDNVSGYKVKEIENSEGTIGDGNTVNVIATNIIEPNKSKFTISKKVIFNKLINNVNTQKFDVNVKVIGNFKIGDKLYDSSNSEIYTIGITLSANKSWESPEITWWGDNAPTVIVEEAQKEGWSIPEYSNNGNTGLKLKKNSNSKIVITNRTKVELDLMMKLAGVVWNDTAEKPDEKDQDTNTPNGRYDTSREQGIEGVQVNVYRVINNSAGKEVKREKAISYSGPFEVETLQPIITSKDGSWQMTGLRVTGFTESEKSQYFSSSEIANRDFSKYSVKYDVEFIYDGQTYEPTKLLEYYDDEDNTNKKATRVEDYLNEPSKSHYENIVDEVDKEEKKVFFGYYIDSLALDYDRETVNNRIQKVYGKTAIDGNGNTVGEVSGDSGKNSILYEADVPSNSARVQSKLQTRDNESNVSYDLYKTTARTSVAGLEFPVKNTYQLEYTGTEYTINGVKQYYRALYEDSLHINLGLKNRKDVDIDATKDLESAKVIVDGKEINYTFNSLADILNQAGLKSLDKTSSTDGQKITYELGLYKTDYYYRAELYKTNADVYDNIQTYYKNLTGKGIEDSELEVYLTYRINLYNSSPTTQYAVKINEVTDYFDSSFGAPIQEKVIKNVNDEAKVIAEPSYITKMKEVEKEVEKDGKKEVEKEYSISDKTTVKWNISKENIKGSDGGTYNKMTADLSSLNIKLASGENRDIFVTFAVKKDTISEVEDCIALGNKSNIVEISNYSTYYSKGATMYCDRNNNEIKADSEDIIAGKIDKDSAPDNVNIENFNDEKKWYEDDTDAAPVLNITLMDDNRRINGTAWEDKAEDNSAVGNGIRDNDEALIGGLTTELIEKIAIPNVEGTGENAKAGNEITEYDFLWPTNEKLSCLGGKTLKQLTGFDSTTETSRESSTIGQYNFTGIPTGTYVVRFLYGNNKLDLEDTKGIDVKPATAYNTNGTLHSGNEAIYTANYDEDLQSQTPAVYNGQDYKSTIYQTGFDTLNNADYKLENEDLKKQLVSDAKDSEYRRLEVIANSETITNVNSSILDSATDISANHNELYEGYSMFADTAKINLNIEYSTDVSQLKGLDVEKAIDENKGIVSPVVQVNSTTDTFTVPKVDFGLIERPETKVVLDKEIKGIKITTNSNKTIFDAEYNISYEIVEASDPPEDRVVISQVDSNHYLVAKVEISNINSKGTDQLQQIDKNERKLENNTKTGTQNFRYINVDTEILQGTTVELTYLLTALNVGETDYTSNIIDEITNITNGSYGTGETTGDPSINIRESLESLAKYAKLSNSKWTTQENAKSEKVKVYETYESWLASNDTYKKYYDTWKTSGVLADYKGYGTYLGMYYYTGDENDSNNRIVTSKIRQLVDYVDNDATFTEEYNGENNHLWKNTTINELSGNGYEKNRLISKDVIPEYEILDKNNISYVTDRRNNLILSVDDQSESNDVVKSNSGFESKLEPIKYYTINKSGNNEGEIENNIRTSINDLKSKLIELKKQKGELQNNAEDLPSELQPQDGEKTIDYADRLLMEYYRENRYISQITLTVTKTVSSQDDTQNMQYDNLAEVVKYENSVGRRDVTSISGNANPKEGEFKTAQKERDSSATELITFAPPTGIEVQNVMKNQILIIVIASLCGVAVGIVVIKKKILK